MQAAVSSNKADSSCFLNGPSEWVILSDSAGNGLESKRIDVDYQARVRYLDDYGLGWIEYLVILVDRGNKRKGAKFYNIIKPGT
jgi:hypothetical protein